MLMLMLQLVPTIPADPAAAPDVATVVSGIMDQIIAAAAPQVQATGMAMWRGAGRHSRRLDRPAHRLHGRFPAMGPRSDRHRTLVPLGDAQLL